jgi:uroporphyrinogen decarboxylase
VCLSGGIDLIYVVKMGTPELIRERVREAIRVAAPGGGYILGTSDSIRDETPLENVRAFFDAGREYGDYRHLGVA